MLDYGVSLFSTECIDICKIAYMAYATRSVQEARDSVQLSVGAPRNHLISILIV